MQFYDHRDEVYRALAQELLDIQLGSAEDAIKLLEEQYPMNSDEVAIVKKYIKRLSRPQVSI